MCRWIGIGEAADLLFLVIHQPADTVLRYIAINQWSVLVWHLDTMANSPARVIWIQPLRSIVILSAWKSAKAVDAQSAQLVHAEYIGEKPSLLASNK